jgi:NAD(P)-dependent dehydrogenase (short-subunit alcohol dehydrogenase family)
MAVELRKVSDQVIVITGASSGIGLCTAKLAAARGATVVLCARDEADLRRAVDEIRERGGEAIFAVADVADREAMERVAATAEHEFGRIDTWINDAGVSTYGLLEEVPVADARRLFDTNYWGVVNGSLAALTHLRHDGGALINIGSTVSDRALPLQGHYSASKHAVKGFTDALRMELERSGVPVSVTLIKPGAIDTPYPAHARNYMDVEPRHPTRVYTPDVVAEAILFCAEHPRRDMSAGAGGKLRSVMNRVPRLADRYMKRTMFSGQRDDTRPTRADRQDALWESHPDDAAERGMQPGRVSKRSLYTRASMHPLATLVGVAVVGAGVMMAARSANGRPD